MTTTVDQPPAAERPVSPLAFRLAASVLGTALLTLVWILAGGPRGWLYLALFALAALPGLPLGFALFGRAHAAGWVAGGLIGYAASAFALWLPVQFHLRSPAPLISWVLLALLCATALLRRQPLVPLPRWQRRDTLALILVLLSVPALVWLPFSRIGSLDAEGNRRYRAYFTADFLWHVALTAELARQDSPPRNPYLANRPLNYYWTYFVVPAFASRTGLLGATRDYLTINAVAAGLLFVSMIFVFAWVAVPRAGPAAAGTLLALLAASAEGLHAVRTLWQRGEPLDSLRNLNIDAISYWFLRGLTVDGLPRSLWYTPQHAAACALGLAALVVPPYAPGWQPLTGIAAGIPLGLALIFSPFLGGAFSLIYGLTAVWCALRARAGWIGVLATTVPAALPVLGAFGWCVWSGTFEGARGAVAIGLSRQAMVAPLMVPALALGPLLAVGLPALVLGWNHRIQGALAALIVGFALFYGVTLTAEPIWIGWRAGQILLVTLPALAAATIFELSRRRLSRVLVRVVVLLAFSVGVPTAAIDLHNAQDVGNAAMGPGFRWTVVVPPDTQAAMQWLRTQTPASAIVQMSIGPRGRETWTLVPTFAERRMAAGQPISLLAIPEYQERSAQADEMFRTPDAATAAELARRLGVQFVYLDRVERQAFGDAAAVKFQDATYFTGVFTEGAAAVYQVR